MRSSLAREVRQLMCGRFALSLPPEAVRRLFGFVEQPNLAPRFNIAPMQPIAIVRAERDAASGDVVRHWTHARWGFLPGFVKDPKGFPLLFNARSESVAEKVSFRSAIRRRRCLVPADAFYEWHHPGGKGARPQPFICRRADRAALGLAGLWETWAGPNGEEVDTACILTTSANEVSAPIHPRLPVVIEPGDFATWLDPDEATTSAALALLRPPGGGVLDFAPIGDAINEVKRDGPEVQEEVALGTPGQLVREAEACKEEQPSLF